MRKIRSRLRPIIGLLGALLLAWFLHGIGWPWWAWVPAAILAGMATFMVQVFAWFLWRKLTYEAFARRLRRRHRAATED